MRHRPLLLLPLLLAACTAPAPPLPAPPPPAPVGPRVFLAPWRFSQAQADSVARSVGCLSSFSAEVDNEKGATIWPQRLPVSGRYLRLRPSQVPGLRVHLRADSLVGHLHDPPEALYYTTQYPVFGGPRASRRLRQLVDEHFTLKAEIAAVRRSERGRPHAEAAPPPETDEEDDYLYREDDENQWETCTAVGAYALPSGDTLVTVAYDHYQNGHGVHGYGSSGTLRFSLARQREVEAAELFGPELARALSYVAAAQELAESSQYYAQYWRDWQHPFHDMSPYGSFPGPGRFFAEWQQQSQYRRRLTDAVQQLRASMARQVAVPESGSNLTYGTGGNHFYFVPQGVVFRLGDDIPQWQVLLPYAALPRYLRPEVGGAGR